MFRVEQASILTPLYAAGRRKFWEFHDKLFADQKNLKLDAFKRHAREIGLDVGQFEKEYFDIENKKTVDVILERVRLKQ